MSTPAKPINITGSTTNITAADANATLSDPGSAANLTLAGFAFGSSHLALASSASSIAATTPPSASLTDMYNAHAHVGSTTTAGAGSLQSKLSTPIQSATTSSTTSSGEKRNSVGSKTDSPNVTSAAPSSITSSPSIPSLDKSSSTSTSTTPAKPQTEGDRLAHSLSSRRSVQELVAQGILMDQSKGSHVQTTQKALLRQAERDRLSSFLMKRPTLDELMRTKQNIMEDTMTWTRCGNVTGSIPLPRNCHTMNAFPNSTKLYLLGGYGTGSTTNSDLLILDTSTDAWMRPSVGGAIPCERYSHTCSSLGNGKLVVFGGFSTNGVWLNDVYVLDTQVVQAFYTKPTIRTSSGPGAVAQGMNPQQHQALQQPSSAAAAPQQQSGHVQRGSSGGGSLSSGQHSESTSRQQSPQMQSMQSSQQEKNTNNNGAIPLNPSSPPFQPFAAQQREDRGNASPNPNHNGAANVSSPSHPPHTTPPQQQSQQLLHTQHSTVSMLMWQQPLCTGTPPLPRAAHTSVVVGERLFIFGGNDGETLFNDLHVLDTSTWTWSSPQTRGQSPAPRAGHTMSLLNGKHLILFGGGTANGPVNDLYILDSETMLWSKPKVGGTPPSPRAGHTSCCLFQNQLLIFGGGYLHKVFNDLHLFNMDNMIWSRPADTGTVPSQRAGHSANVLQSRIYVFAGGDAEHVYNDLHILDTAFLRIHQHHAAHHAFQHHSLYGHGDSIASPYVNVDGSYAPDRPQAPPARIVNTTSIGPNSTVIGGVGESGKRGSLSINAGAGGLLRAVQGKSQSAPNSPRGISSMISLGLNLNIGPESIPSGTNGSTNSLSNASGANINGGSATNSLQHHGHVSSTSDLLLDVDSLVASPNTHNASSYSTGVLGGGQAQQHNQFNGMNVNTIAKLLSAARDREEADATLLSVDSLLDRVANVLRVVWSTIDTPTAAENDEPIGNTGAGSNELLLSDTGELVGLSANASDSSLISGLLQVIRSHRASQTAQSKHVIVSAQNSIQREQTNVRSMLQARRRRLAALDPSIATPSLHSRQGSTSSTNSVSPTGGSVGVSAVTSASASAAPLSTSNQPININSTISLNNNSSIYTPYNTLSSASAGPTILQEGSSVFHSLSNPATRYAVIGDNPHRYHHQQHTNQQQQQQHASHHLDSLITPASPSPYTTNLFYDPLGSYYHPSSHGMILGPRIVSGDGGGMSGGGGPMSPTTASYYADIGSGGSIGFGNGNTTSTIGPGAPTPSQAMYRSTSADSMTNLDEIQYVSSSTTNSNTGGGALSAVNRVVGSSRGMNMSIGPASTSGNHVSSSSVYAPYSSNIGGGGNSSSINPYLNPYAAQFSNNTYSSSNNNNTKPMNNQSSSTMNNNNLSAPPPSKHVSTSSSGSLVVSPSPQNVPPPGHSPSSSASSMLSAGGGNGASSAAAAAAAGTPLKRRKRGGGGKYKKAAEVNIGSTHGTPSLQPSDSSTAAAVPALETAVGGSSLLQVPNKQHNKQGSISSLTSDVSSGTVFTDE